HEGQQGRDRDDVHGRAVHRVVGLGFKRERRSHHFPPLRCVRSAAIRSSAVNPWSAASESRRVGDARKRGPCSRGGSAWGGSAGGEKERTPGLVSLAPGGWGDAYPRATVLALPWRSPASCRTVGSCSPADSLPAAIAARNARSSCA